MTEPQVSICAKCSKQFKIVTVERQFYEKNKLPLPSYCPACRKELRDMWRNKKELIKGTCSNCGKEIVTTPKFSPAVKVFCKECYEKYDETHDNLIK